VQPYGWLHVFFSAYSRENYKFDNGNQRFLVSLNAIVTEEQKTMWWMQGLNSRPEFTDSEGLISFTREEEFYGRNS
jgi:hypothetical protein